MAPRLALLLAVCVNALYTARTTHKMQELEQTMAVLKRSVELAAPQRLDFYPPPFPELAWCGQTHARRPDVARLCASVQVLMRRQKWEFDVVRADLESRLGSKATAFDVDDLRQDMHSKFDSLLSALSEKLDTSLAVKFQSRVEAEHAQVLAREVQLGGRIDKLNTSADQGKTGLHEWEVKAEAEQAQVSAQEDQLGDRIDELKSSAERGKAELNKWEEKVEAEEPVVWWHLADKVGESCDDVCRGVGRQCTEARWPLSEEAARDAFGTAGISCNSFREDGYFANPLLYIPTGECQWSSEVQAHCVDDYVGSFWKYLCACLG